MPDDQPISAEPSLATPELAQAQVSPEASDPLSEILPHEEHVAMIDIHDAHHAASTWKEFFIHIATIVLGLLIAVGLEQGVEYIHHRRELAEARREIATERKINIVRFSVETEEFHRFVPILENNLAIFVYLRQHPGKPLPASYGTLRWGLLSTGRVDSAWTAAQRSGAVAYMPQSEVRKNSELYLRLDDLRQAIRDARNAVFECQRFRIVDPDPAHLSPGQLDQEIDLASRALFTFRGIAFIMVNAHETFPDFTPAPSRSDMAAITRAPPPTADNQLDGKTMLREMDAYKNYERSLDQNEPPE